MEKIEQLNIWQASVKVDEEYLQEKHDKQYKETKLTPREWEVYRLIYHNSIVENRRTSQREICDKISGFKWNDNPKAHDHCPSVWQAIAHNNLSFEHEKIIIAFNFEYWIGNELETQVFLDNLWQDIAPRLNRYWTYLRKIKRNGQGRLFDKNFNVLDFDDENVRGFIESYAKD